MREGMMKLNIIKTLKFFDEESKESSHHATAIVAVLGEDLGISLLQKYLKEAKGLDAIVLNNDGVPITPTPGTKKGQRLDRWLSVTSPSGRKKWLYQVEIKNWSSHAIGGEKHPDTNDERILAEYRRRRWKIRWNKRGKETNKVLMRMKPPKEYSSLNIKPVICYWESLHPRGIKEALFEMPVNEEGDYDKVMVFSMSNYLRTMNDKWISLPMPMAMRRVNWLNELVK